MNDREKLVELLGEFPLFPSTMKKAWMPQAVEKLADHLLANGVTVQRWIPVTERLPEKNTAVIAVTDNGIVFQCLYGYDGWDLWEGNEVHITHWTPLPEPPKED